MAVFYGALYFVQSLPILVVAAFHAALGWILADRFRFDALLAAGILLIFFSIIWIAL